MSVDEQKQLLVAVIGGVPSIACLALSALVFLYKHVLAQPFPELDHIARARKPVRIPNVLSRDEVARILDELAMPYWLIASLLYGAGLRLLEACQLRIKDIDLDRRELVIRPPTGLLGFPRFPMRVNIVVNSEELRPRGRGGFELSAGLRS
jgi:integrase